MGEEKKRRLTKNEKRRLRRKTCKNNDNSGSSQHKAIEKNQREVIENDLGIEVEYVPETINISFLQGTDRFNFQEINKLKEEEPTGDDEIEANSVRMAVERKIREAEEKKKLEEEIAREERSKRPSKKERKKMKAESVSALKQEVDRPDLVETHDVSSPDPKFLVQLKALKNSVEVPKHWNSKYRYLQNRKGFDASRYQLPQFLLDAGVRAARRATAADTGQTASQKARERLRPKLGRIDIDYQRLHEAFFKHQKKFYLPELRKRLSRHGQAFNDGVGESIFRHKRINLKNNVLSEKLKKALGITTSLVPVPWLINMQRFGPPPSYKGLIIPGLNAPIPSGASFGYHVNGWGKPPVDAGGRPIYGDAVFKQPSEVSHLLKEEKIRHWGDISDVDSETDDESDQEESEEEEEVRARIQEPMEVESKPVAEIQAEVEDESEDEEMDDREMDLRKASEKEEEEQKQLYKVIQQRKAKDTGAMLQPGHEYDFGNDDADDEEEDFTAMLSKSNTSSTKGKNQDSAENFKF